MSVNEALGPLIRPPVGQPAPDLDLLTADGDAWHLRDHLGSTVVLIFHRHIH